jgi:hypothetical protein
LENFKSMFAPVVSSIPGANSCRHSSWLPWPNAIHLR